MPARHALVVSAAVHAVVVAVVAGRAITVSVTEPEPTPGVAAIEVVTVAPAHAEQDAVAVTIIALPDETRTATPPRVAAAAPRGRPIAAMTSGAGTTGIGTVEPGTATRDLGATGGTEPTTTVPSRMRMRGHDLSLPGKTATDFLASSKPLVEVPSTGRLEQRGREHVVHDTVTTMRIHEDGRVTFKDKPDAEIHWALPLPSRKGIGDALAGWYADPYAQTKFRKVQDMATHEQAVEGGWDAGAGGDGTPSGKESKPGNPSSGGPTVPILGGTFDVTAYAMRKFGMDPYASRKLKLLDDTRDERAAIGAAHAQRQLGRSAELMQRNVERLWVTTVEPGARRAALFALWDECAEGEALLGQAGERARAIVIGWIRARVPAGSAEAFTVGEIAELDRRRTSRQHFVPY